MKKILLISGLALSLIACGENDNNSDKAQVEENAEETSEEQTQEPTEVPDPIDAESSDKYSYEMVVEGLKIPWGFTFLPDGSMLINEKNGDIIHFKDGQKNKIQGGPEVYDRGQGGLMDVVLHPNYENNGWIYFSYASKEGEDDGGNTAVLRAKLEGNQLTSKEVLYKASPNTTKGQHFGSRIAFDKDGYLYFSAGERGARDENPQDITRDNGKVYRLNDDGSVPSDNPFVNQENAVEAIYSYGHRNPQGMILNPETGEIWVHEHGPKGGDEINIVKKGANFGWPVVTYGENYSGTSITDERSRPEMEDPIFYWLPSIAPSGFAYITSVKFPELKGNLLAGSLKFQYLELLKLDGKKINKRTKLLEDSGRMRDVRQGPDGNIYVAIEGKGIAKLINKQ
ncbi:PQQ-dependent sugar dehydrogenase [Christiangramia forsetii]|uniref:Glucose/sorbosone dehydrogenase n=2 Tax=Christiangramia forsetii TaxID=411153 RepID=A0LZJ5_CHRFK|nr:PQQ-dependent sugar dehydrogenase [Christiangramia forsetii]GGG38460.1 pyrroloquinoline-quinone glucose dehydrogenase [Christiangramia forsetii]CAL65790.1 glucose/sorbosone dehydrogenase [Christiangramia forsetii KT0803]